ncbi:type II secretion system pilot lipoprotein GspS [Escherichia coli]
MMNNLNPLISIASLFLMSAITGCQHSQTVQQQKIISEKEQHEQIASVVAATKYLKYKCNRSDLPDASVIIDVASRVAIQNGWKSLVLEEIVKNSDTIYLRLTRDSTPEKTKCSYFNRELRPFIEDCQRSIK